jgi:imidazoleglycerol phosphate dehydratase HisB
MVSKIDSDTALVVVVSPNNPTGGLISEDQIERIAEAARSAGAKLLLDHAYIEFADAKPTEQLLVNDNIMILRTFSKAFGLAGLRVGYLVAPTKEFASTVRDAAGPFPVSAVSLETARRALADYQPQMEANLAAVKAIRALLHDLIVDCGGRPLPSQGNFILAEFDDHEAVWLGLAEDGVGVRKFVGNPLLDGRLRITCPVLPAEFLQLAQSLCRISKTDFGPYKSALGMAMNPGHVVQEVQPDVVPATESTDQADRTWSSHRQTKETNIELNLNLDGTGKIEIQTGIGFLDHMLTALAFHAGMDLTLKCDGDLHVDDHHTAEDCALALGSAIDQALGKRTGIRRFGYAYAPLDEALARTVIDLSGRPWPEIHLNLEREMVGQWACENITHFFQSLAMTLKCSLHIDVLRGTNDHHRAEAAFKSCAKALREAITRTAGAVPSTKGTLDD